MRFCGTLFEENFENYFSVSFMLFNTVGLALAVKYQEHMQLQHRVMVPLVVSLIVFAITTLLVTIKVDPLLLFWVTLISCAVCGFANAIGSGGLFGFAAMLPARYTGALMSGQGLAGFFVSMASALTTAFGPEVDLCTDDDSADDDDGDECSDDTDYSAFSFFLVSCVVLATCIVAFIVLVEMPYTKHYIQIFKEHESKARQLSLARAAASPFVTDKNLIANLEEEGLDENVVLLNDNNKTESLLPASNDAVPTISLKQMMRVFGKIKVQALLVFYCFVVTLSIFPSITVLIESENKCDRSNRFYNDMWIPFIFLMFTTFDFVGRVLASMFTCGITPNNIWIPMLLRTAFFPLFLLCNIPGSQLGTVFTSDAWPIVFMFLFATSNGYLSSLCMMFGPGLVEPRDTGVAGTMMVFFLTLGLLSGASFSFVLRLISQGSV